MPERSRALILDFGGVITRTMFETHPMTERVLGLPNGALTWKGPFDPAGDDLWQSMQADEISERDYWLTRTREVGEMIGKEWTRMADMLIASRGDAPAEMIRPEFLATLEKVKQAGVTVAILSNELDLFYGADFRHKLPFLDDIDVIHDATYTRTLKPDPVAYQAILQDFGLPASACVFVDDQKRNVTGARAVGLPSVHFDVMNPGASYAEALTMLGLEQEVTP